MTGWLSGPWREWPRTLRECRRVQLWRKEIRFLYGHTGARKVDRLSEMLRWQLGT